MPSKTASKSADSANKGRDTGNFVNDYLADWDDDDPFRSPSPEPAKNGKETEKKTDTLGIEKELDLKRKPRVPRVKLDDARLLSDKGIPKLRKTVPRLKFKGKGHEFSDAARLLSFYQEWLDDLFPKATFLDALAMVEKTGHKTTIRNARLKWIDESKPRAAVEEDEEDNRIYQRSQQPSQVAPVFENAANGARERAKTPAAEDLFGDDDIYNATPLRNAASTAPSRQVTTGDIPDEDDLDALMAEAEASSTARLQPAPVGSIFGNGLRSTGPQAGGEPDDDDLDALMAEAEAQSAQARPSQPPARESIFGDGKPKQPANQGTDNDDDLDALMAEAEAAAPGPFESRTEKKAAGNIAPATGTDPSTEEDDDLDALMAETEANAEATARPSSGPKNASSAGADAGQQKADFDDDEEAMAEMDGLW